MLRFLVLWLRADFTNPFAQFLFRVTNPPLRQLRPYVPQWQGLELSGLLLMWILQYLSLAITHSLLNQPINWLGLSILADAQLIALLINVFLIGLFIQVVVSWIAPNQYNPILNLIYRLNQPLLTWVQRYIPATQGIDFSPMVVMLALYLALALVVTPLTDFGLSL